MIYIFGTGTNLSVIANGNTLTDEEKNQATFATEELPIFENIEGFLGVLTLSDDRKTLFYTYVEIVEEEIND